MTYRLPRSRKVIFIFAASLALAALACARSDTAMPAASTDPTETPDSSPLIGSQLTPSSEPNDPNQTPTPNSPFPPASVTPPATPTSSADTFEEILYYAQPGDTVKTVAIRFGVLPQEIKFPDGGQVDDDGLLDIDRLLVIPSQIAVTGPSNLLIPDSELVFSPHATDFNVSAFVEEQGGYLSAYTEFVGGETRSGGEVVALAARNHSVNPRLLLAILEHQAGWVTDPSRPGSDGLRYPLGNEDQRWQGLFRQLTWLTNELGNGYYGWRSGTLTDVTFADGSVVRLAPEINAGTAALQYYFTLSLQGRPWAEALGQDGLLATYQKLFGDPWEYFHPLYEPGVHQPELILPFIRGRVWAYTGGPHGAWEREAAWAALDFAPSTTETGCKVSEDWAVAAAPGLVLRSENGVVVLDLDGDGREQTGWVLIYLHMAAKDRIEAGAFLERGDFVGHPSCEGGIASGSHLHLTRKYNGEWILADGALPFNLSGWTAQAGSVPYEGALAKDGEIVIASPFSPQETLISR